MHTNEDEVEAALEVLPPDYQAYLDSDPGYEEWANEYDRQTELIRQAKSAIPSRGYPLANRRENKRQE